MQRMVWRTLFGSTLVAMWGCGGKETPRANVAPASVVPDAGPPSEVSFVPDDADAIVRVDLGALAQHPETAQMFDFVLRAQQPLVWKTLSAAGLGLGTELKTLYLVVIGQAEPRFLLGGLGHIDVVRVAEALQSAGSTAEPVYGGTVFRWREASNDATGAAVPRARTRLDSVVGVAEGLLLLGPSALVTRALGARAGHGPDARNGPLAADLAALAQGSTAWGIARGAEDEAWLRSFAPGATRIKFHAAIPRVGQGNLTLVAEFLGPAHAAAFRTELDRLLVSAMVMTRGSSLASTFERIKVGATVAVIGSVVDFKASL